jgi:hypothetical protein
MRRVFRPNVRRAYIVGRHIRSRAEVGYKIKFRRGKAAGPDGLMAEMLIGGKECSTTQIYQHDTFIQTIT